jgi:hypothetical protein
VIASLANSMPMHGASPRPPVRSRSAFLLGIALFLLLAVCALGARWGGGHEAPGARFLPRPDALEYAASAQAIAQSFRFSLVVGPYAIRPRYPPGWPFLLALAIRLGVAGEDLWRVAGLCGAALCGLIGVGSAVIVYRLGVAFGAVPRRALGGAAFAGLLAGMSWAYGAVAVAAGSVGISDEPTALFGALALCAAAGVGQMRSAGSSLAAFGGGTALGLVLSMRPVCALLLLPALAVFWLGVPRSRFIRLFGLWAGGAAVVPLLTMALLLRSGLSPWHWSAYDLWAPRWYANLGTTFNLRYALLGNTDFERGPNGIPIPNLIYYSKILFGIPGLDRQSYLGLFWPAVAWAAGLALVWHLDRRFAEWSGRLRRSLLAASLVVAAYLALYSLYFFPSARFILLPLAAAPVLLAVAIGVSLASPSGRWLPRVAILVALLWSVAIWEGSGAIRPMISNGPDPFTVRRQFNAWRELPRVERAQMPLPFDPVEAQALGLLPPEVLSTVDAWGFLPETVHVRRMRALGLLR